MSDVRVKISSASLRQMFRPCDPTFIATVCGARCCDSASRGCMVTIHPTETAAILSVGGKVLDGFLVPSIVTGRCQFKQPSGLCAIHETAQPFGCIASPFTVNRGGTLIVRNRYRLLKCYKAEGSLPAYLAHQRSLDHLFGAAESYRIRVHLAGGGGDIEAMMPADNYAKLVENDIAKTQLAEVKRERRETEASYDPHQLDLFGRGKQDERKLE